MSQVATLKGLKCPHCGSEDVSVTGIKGALGTAVATDFLFGAVGQIAAGKNAAKNIETQPLQYQCSHCTKKFESLPLCAPPEEVLDRPCQVTFTREKSFVGAIVPQIVYLNGIKMGAVKNGESIQFATYSRYNVLFVTDQHGVAFKSVYPFEAHPGEEVAASFKRKFYGVPVRSVPSSEPDEKARTQVKMDEDVQGSVPAQERFCAYCGKEVKPGTVICPHCGKKSIIVQMAEAAEAGGVQEARGKTWAIGLVKAEKVAITLALLAGVWVLLLLLQGPLTGRLLYNREISFFIVAAMTGTSIYLVLQDDSKHQRQGLVGGVLSVIFYAISCMTGITMDQVRGEFFLFPVTGSEVLLFLTQLIQGLALIGLTMGGAYYAWKRLADKDPAQRMDLTAKIAGALYALVPIMVWLYGNIFLIINSQQGYGDFIFDFIGFLQDAFILYLFIKLVDRVCKSENHPVELYGLGRLWVRIGAVIMPIAFLKICLVAFGVTEGLGYTASLFLALAQSVGYILLVGKRREGLYLILSAGLIVLNGQASEGIVAIGFGLREFDLLFFMIPLEICNALFAWLAVRAADRRGLVSQESSA